jgi:transposase
MKTSKNPSSPIVHWVGIDVAKATFDAAFVRHGQKFPATPLACIPARSFERTQAGVEELAKWLETLNEDEDDSAATRVIMEATGGYSIELAAWITQQNPEFAPAIAPPRQTAAFLKSLGLRNKTDKIEARALGFYGMERQPPAYQALTPEEANLRELSRCRDFLVQQRVAEHNRFGEMKSASEATKIFRRRLAQIERDIKKLEAELHKCIDALPELSKDIQLLCTIYGVGFITAVTIRLEMGDLRRFNKARQLTAYAGLNPTLRQSGASVNGRPHMNKHGNSRVRQALYLSAMVVIRGDNDLKHTYMRLREQGKSAMSALGAVMRKLLVLMRAILISGRVFDPLWKTRPASSRAA